MDMRMMTDFGDAGGMDPMAFHAMLGMQNMGGLPQPPPPGQNMNQNRGGKGKGKGKRRDDQSQGHGGPMHVHPLQALAMQGGGGDENDYHMNQGVAPAALLQRMADRSSEPPPGWAGVTTLMMRNLPNKYSQRMLLTEINEVGFLGTFDFLYLPIDPETAANRGYAFLNFIDQSFAWMFKLSYDGRKMCRFKSNKVVSVMPATLQGFDANYMHYSTARVSRGDPAARPLFLREPSQPVAKHQRNGKKISQIGGQRKTEFNEDAPPRAPPATAAQNVEAPWPQGGSNGGYPAAAPPPGANGNGTQADVDDGSANLVAKFCPHCGSPTKAAFKFCPQCGNNTSFSGEA